MRRKFSILILPVTFFVSSCANPNDGLEEEAKGRLRLILSDVDSSKFYMVSKSDKALCGFVNSKNKFGLYEGYSAFFAKNNAVMVMTLGLGELDEIHNLFIDSFNKYCSKEVSLSLNNYIQNKKIIRIGKIKNNILIMIKKGASEEEVSDYIEAAGAEKGDIRAYQN